MARCLSVRLSQTGIKSKWLYNSVHILTVLMPSGSPTVLVFSHQTGWQYSDGTPLMGTSNAREYEKNHDFRPTFHFISHMMQDRAIVTMEGE